MGSAVLRANTSFARKWVGSRVGWRGLRHKSGARDLADGQRSWQAAKINVLLCFMPVPYGSHPYLFSLTAVPFEQFVFFFMLVCTCLECSTAR